MATYIGFSTQNYNKPRSNNMEVGYYGGTGTLTNPLVPGKKFRLTDKELVIRDFMNALSIRQGTIAGNPAFGTTVWNFIFEPSTQMNTEAIYTEMQRVASLDPRIVINDINIFTKDNGVLMELNMVIQPFDNEEVIQMFFNPETNTVY